MTRARGASSRTMATSRSQSAGAIGSPVSLRLVVPARVTIAVVRRVGASTSTSRWGMPARSRSCTNSTCTGPPIGAMTIAGSCCWCSTRATLTPLPPAHARPVGTRWLVPGRSSSIA